MGNDKLTMADVPCLVAIGGPTCLALQLLGYDKLTMADVPCLVALGGPTRPSLSWSLYTETSAGLASPGGPTCLAWRWVSPLLGI